MMNEKQAAVIIQKQTFLGKYHSQSKPLKRSQSRDVCRSKSPISQNQGIFRPFNKQDLEKALNLFLELMIIGEIYQRCAEILKTKQQIEYGQEHKELLFAYEQVLREQGLDHSKDTEIYKQLMKIDLKRNSTGQNPFDILHIKMNEKSKRKRASDHYLRALKLKAFFTLVKNMVSQIMIPSRNHEQAERSISQIIHQPQFATVISNSTDACTLGQFKRSNTTQQQVAQGKENTNRSHRESNIVKTQTQDSKNGKRTSRSKENKKKKNSFKIRQPLTVSSKEVNIKQIKSQNQHNFDSQSFKHKTIFTSCNETPSYQISVMPPTINKSVSQLSLIPSSSTHSKLEKKQNQNDISNLIHLSSFKLLLKCLRLWRRWVFDQKTQRARENQRHLENMAVSIHYHEQTLLNKSMLGLQRHAKVNLRMKLVSRIIRRRRENRAKRQCMRSLHQYAKMSEGKKLVVYKALNLWSSNLIAKVFLQWSQFVRESKENRDNYFIRLVNKPKALQCILAIANIDDYIFLKKTKNETIESRMIRLSLQKSKNQAYFNVLKSLLYRDGLKISLLHFRYCLRKLKEHLLNRFQLKTLLTNFRQHKVLAQKHQIFSQWILRCVGLSKKRNNFSKAIEFERKNLSQKGYIGLRQNRDTRILSQSQLKQSVNTRLNKFIEKCFQGWRFISIYNRKSRTLELTLKTERAQVTKKNIFYLWIEEALLNSRARTFFQTQTYKRVLSAFIIFIEQKEIKEERLQSLKLFRNLQISRQVFGMWRIICKKEQKERTLRTSINNYYRESLLKRSFNTFKFGLTIQRSQQQILVEAQTYLNRRKLQLMLNSLQKWSTERNRLNSIFEQISERIKYSREHNVFTIWNQKFRNRSRVNESRKQVAQKRLIKITDYYLQTWIMLTNLQIQRKVNLQRMIVQNCIRSVFDQLNEYRLEKNQFRNKLHRFLRFRASLILKKAFASLKSFTRQRLLKIKLNKVAKYIFFRRLLLTTFSAFKTHRLRMLSFKQVSKALNSALLSCTLRRWKVEYLRTDISKTLQLRRDTKKKFLVFHQIKVKATEWHRLRVAKEKIQGRVSLRLLTKAYQAVSAYREVKRRSIELKTLVRKYNQKRLARKYFDRLLRHTSYRLTKAEQLALIFRRRMINIIFAFFEQMRIQLVKNHAKKFILKPIVDKKTENIKRQCLRAIYIFAFEKQKERLKVKKAQNLYKKSIQIKVFDGFAWYIRQQKAYLIKNQTAQLFNIQRLLRKGTYSLHKFRLLKSYERHLIHSNQLNFLNRYLTSWYELFIDRQGQKNLYEIAERHQLKKVFNRFLHCFAIFRIYEGYKRSQRQLAWSYRRKRVESKALQLIKKYIEIRRAQKRQKRAADVQYLAKVIRGWYQSRPEIKISNDRYKQSIRFRRNHLKIQVFIHFAIVVKDLKHYRLKLEYLRKLTLHNLQKIVLTALHQNVETQHLIREKLRLKLPLFTSLKLRPPFALWHHRLVTDKLNETSLWFRTVLWPKHIKLNVLHSLRTLTRKRTTLRAIAHKLTLSLDNSIKDKIFTKMLSTARYTALLDQKCSEFIKKLDFKRTKVYILAFQKQILQSKGTNNIKEQAVTLRNGNLCRKAMIGLQKCLWVSQSMRYVDEHRNINMKSCIIRRWRVKYYQNLASQAIYDNIEKAQKRSKMFKCFDKIRKHSLQKELNSKVQGQRMMRRVLLFFDMLRTRMIYSRIIRSYKAVRDQGYKRKVLQALEDNKHTRVQHQSVLEIQVSGIMEQSNLELMACAFTSLQIYTKLCHLKKVAGIKYAQSLSKKALYSLSLNNQKSKILHFSSLNFQIKQKGRFFLLWFEAIQNKRNAQVVSKVLNANHLTRILLAWRYLIEKKQLSSLYFTASFRKRIMPQIFSALKINLQNKKYLQQCEQEIVQNRQFTIIKEAFLQWMEYLNLNKIESNMEKYYQFKQAKMVIDSWKQLQVQNSMKRRSKIEIRRALKRKPELSKPLFVLRKPQLWNAFQLFKKAIKGSKRRKQHLTRSSLAFYLRLLRKSFDSLRLNIYRHHQARSVFQVRNLFILRRGFNSLRKAVDQRKWQKQARIESCVFNFLSIQRKGLMGLIRNARARREQRYKILLANEIYYKGLAVKVISVLRSIIKPSDDQVDEEQYMLQCEINQFDNNNPPMFSPLSPLTEVNFNEEKHYCDDGGDYGHHPDDTMQHLVSAGATTAMNEVGDMTNTGIVVGTLAFSMTNNNRQQPSQSPDRDEIQDREYLVCELYEKRLLFKCFISWMQQVQQQ